MGQTLTISQWNEYKANGWTDELLAQHGYTLAKPTPAAPTGGGDDWDKTTGDSATLQRPKLPVGDWPSLTILGVEGPTETSYGPAFFIAVRAPDGAEYSIKHALGTAAKKEGTRRALANLVFVAGAPNLGAIRDGWPTPVRASATSHIAEGTQKPYTRVNWLPPITAPQLPPLPPSMPPPPPAGPGTGGVP